MTIEMELKLIPYITLWAVNFEAMAAFYRDKLRLPVEYVDENFIQFATQGTKLYIHRLGTAPSLREHAVEIHFEVSDVDAAYAELCAHGVEFEEAPANRPWGARMAALRDPEGFALEIVGPLDPDELMPTYRPKSYSKRIAGCLFHRGITKTQQAYTFISQPSLE